MSKTAELKTRRFYWTINLNFWCSRFDRQYRHSRQICSVLGQKCIVQQNAIAKSVDYSLKNEVDPGTKSWIWSIQWSFFFIITTYLRVAYGIINICYKFGRIYDVFFRAFNFMKASALLLYIRLLYICSKNRFLISCWT